MKKKEIVLGRILQSITLFNKKKYIIGQVYEKYNRRVYACEILKGKIFAIIIKVNHNFSSPLNYLLKLTG